VLATTEEESRNGFSNQTPQISVSSAVSSSGSTESRQGFTSSASLEINRRIGTFSAFTQARSQGASHPAQGFPSGSEAAAQTSLCIHTLRKMLSGKT